MNNKEEQYNCLCLSCKRNCKQSDKVMIVDCPLYDYNGQKVVKHRSEYRPQKERELTDSEKRSIKKLVQKCATFDKKEQQCLLLDTICPMLNKAYTGKMCSWFENAVLPLDPSLERLLKRNSNILQKICGSCGRIFTAVKNKKYCSDKCKEMAKKQADRERARKYRNSKR